MRLISICSVHCKRRPLITIHAWIIFIQVHLHIPQPPFTSFETYWSDHKLLPSESDKGMQCHSYRIRLRIYYNHSVVHIFFQQKSHHILFLIIVNASQSGHTTLSVSSLEFGYTDTGEIAQRIGL